MILPIDVILVPQGAEYQAVCRGIKQVKPPHPQVIPIPIGINAVSEYLNQKKEQIFPTSQEKVILMGLGGSLSSNYQVGDMVIYSDCVMQSNNNQSPFSLLKCDRILSNYLDVKLNSKVSLVTGLTSNKVISNCLEKLNLAKIYQAQVIDMEAYAVLSSLRDKSIAVTVVRIISDDINHNIPDISAAIDINGKLKYFTLTKQMLKQPFAALNLINGSLIGLKKLEQTAKILVRAS